MLSRFLYDMANIILNLDVEGSVMIPSMGVGVPAIFLNFGDPYHRKIIISYLLHLIKWNSPGNEIGIIS